ncbi:MAG: hypothetical protein ACKV22_24185 [Bryobacteraceae bacterium]
MASRYLILAVMAALTLEFPLAAQYPGGYPPGYPGGGRLPGGGLPPLPGRSKKSSKQQKPQENLRSLTGILRELGDERVVIEAKDTRIINCKRTPDTKFFATGAEVKSSALKPGDHLMVQVTQDEEGFFTAANVILQKAGTAEERAEASAPVMASTQKSTAEDERPILRRSDSPPKPDKEEEEEEDAPAATPPVAPVHAPAPTAPAPPAVEAVAPAAPDPNVEVIPLPPGAKQEEPIDESDPGPPVLRRGKPAPRKPAAVRSRPEPTNAPVTAASRLPDRAPELPPSAAPQPLPEVALEAPTPPDPVIVKAKAEIDRFTATLPSYICKEQIARFVNTTHTIDWRPLDLVGMDLVYENGREHYRNVTVNGKPVNKKLQELSGAWSTGEFATVLVDLFSPSTAADFRRRSESRMAGRAALPYDFTVEQEHSHWHIQVASESVTPAYKGTIWLDKETKRVLRVEMQASRMPVEFSLDKVESATDFEFVRIGERQFLLPVHAESLMCQRGTNRCSKNIIDFRNYHKYSGEANITFDK